MPQHRALYKSGVEVIMQTKFLGKVEHKYLELAAANYFNRTIATFVMRMSFLVAKSQSTSRLSRHTVRLATQ